jgi:hypothetical protein
VGGKPGATPSKDHLLEGAMYCLGYLLGPQGLTSLVHQIKVEV